jgi:hypothetical protein
MLWLGGALNVTDTVISTVGSQTDIPKTLLNQLEMSATSYEFSKDLFSDEVKSFAFYTFNNGFGLVGEDFDLVYDHDAGHYMTKNGSFTKSHQETGLAYMQKLFWDFNRR